MGGGDTWDHLGRYLAALAGCALLGYFGFVGGNQVPLLGFVDLGFHELGHMLFMWAPDMVMFLAGSGTQVAVPFGLAAYFLIWRRDAIAGSLMLAWTGTSLKDASVYIADAPYQHLPLLFPGATHDWAWILGPEGFDAITAAGTVATVVAVAGAVSVLGGMGLAIGAGLVAQRSLEATLTRRRWFGTPRPGRAMKVRPAKPVVARLPSHRVTAAEPDPLSDWDEPVRVPHPIPEAS